MNNTQLPVATAWITVIETSQGTSNQVNWEKMIGVNHYPLFTAEQMREYANSMMQQCWRGSD